MNSSTHDRPTSLLAASQSVESLGRREEPSLSVWNVFMSHFGNIFYFFNSHICGGKKGPNLLVLSDSGDYVRERLSASCLWLFHFVCCRLSKSTCQVSRLTLALRSSLKMPEQTADPIVPACTEIHREQWGQFLSSSSSTESQVGQEANNPLQTTMRRQPSHQTTKQTSSLLFLAGCGRRATLHGGNTGETQLMSAADQKHDCCV